MQIRGTCGIFFLQENGFHFFILDILDLRGTQVFVESSLIRKGGVTSPKNISSHSRKVVFFMTLGSYA
jgi:hypothetical protein